MQPDLDLHEAYTDRTCTAALVSCIVCLKIVQETPSIQATKEPPIYKQPRNPQYTSNQETPSIQGISMPQ